MRRWSLLYKLLFLAFVVLGSMVTPTNILAFCNALLFWMAFPNLLGLVLLSGKVRRSLDEYWHKYKSGNLHRRSPRN